MEDNQSPVVNDDVPASDDVLSILNDTEDAPTENVETVEETLEEQEVDEAESPTEGEVSEEESEELQANDDPKEEARRWYEERQKAKADQAAKAQQASEDYINQVDDETEQRIRTIEAREYVRTVENNLSTLVNEFERVKANPDLQIFNPDNKDTFNERAYNKAIRDYNAGYLGYDENGSLIQIKGSLYEHLTETADLLKDAVNDGAVQQVRATKKMRANADTKPAAPPKEAQKDQILDILSSD